MRKFICFLLIGFVASLVSSVTAANFNSDVGPNAYVVSFEKQVSKTSFSENLNVTAFEAPAGTVIHFAVAAERQRLRPLPEKYVDPYILKLPKHFLLPEKNPIARDEDPHLRC